MPMFGSSAAFRAAKKKTKAYKQYPKNVREMLNISNIYPNGIFCLEPGNGMALYDVCYIFEDINYINQDKPVKASILTQLMEWMKSMTINYKITVANEYRNMQEFLQEISGNMDKEEYPELADGVERWMREKLSDGNPDVRKVMYLTVTCRAKDYQEASSYFQMLDVQIKRFFLSWKSQIYQLDMMQRLKVLYAFFHPGEELEEREEYAMFPDTWKNDVLPASLEQFKNFLILDEQYISILFAKQYSSSLDEGKVISGFSRVPYPSYVTLDYAPVDRQALEGKLAAAHMNNEKAIGQELDRKRRQGQYLSSVSYSKEKRKEELESYRDQVADNDELCVYIGLMVVVTATDEDTLAGRIEQIKRIGGENGVALEIYNFRQLKALNTALPFGGRQVDVMRPFLTSSAVSLQPYYAQDIQDIGGFLYGSNRTTKRLILGDRKKLKNPHGMIIGHTGSGKSLLMKLTELSQTLISTKDDILMIDPQNECQDYCLQHGGQFYDLTPNSHMYLNPLEIPEEVFYGEPMIRKRFIADQTTFAISFCSAAMQNIVTTQEHYSVIGRCIRKMYETYLDQKTLKTQPTLLEFREELKKELDKADNEDDRQLIRKIYNSLEEYTEGSYDMFAQPTNIEINKRLVIFGMQNVSEDMWETAMITVMHVLSNRMEYNRKLQRATRFIVDETQVVCKNKTSADMLLKSVVTFRKFGGICTMALQNLTRALENPELRDMFSNCEYKCFLDQGGVDAQALSQIQELSSTEFQSLNEDVPGYGVMVWGKKIVLFDSYMKHDNPLYQHLSTNFHEKAAQTEKEGA